VFWQPRTRTASPWGASRRDRWTVGSSASSSPSSCVAAATARAVPTPVFVAAAGVAIEARHVNQNHALCQQSEARSRKSNSKR
jgi:hypothetical protein